MHALAYDLIRGVIAVAAEEYGEQAEAIELQGGTAGIGILPRGGGPCGARREGEAGRCDLEDDRLAASGTPSQPGGAPRKSAGPSRTAC